METTIFFLGRLLLGGYFIFSGYNHFAMAVPMSGYAQSKGVPAAKSAVIFSGLLLITGGLSVLSGLYPIVGAASLALFLVPVTFIMHAFWKVQDPQMKMGEMVNFNKNLALLGATLMLLAIPQPWPLSL